MRFDSGWCVQPLESGTVVNTDKSSRRMIPDGAEELRDWLEVSDVQIDYLIFLQLKNFFLNLEKRERKQLTRSV